MSWCETMSGSAGPWLPDPIEGSIADVAHPVELKELRSVYTSELIAIPLSEQLLV